MTQHLTPHRTKLNFTNLWSLNCRLDEEATINIDGWPRPTHWHSQFFSPVEGCLKFDLSTVAPRWFANKKSWTSQKNLWPRISLPKFHQNLLNYVDEAFWTWMKNDPRWPLFIHSNLISCPLIDFLVNMQSVLKMSTALRVLCPDYARFFWCVNVTSTDPFFSLGKVVNILHV